MSAGYSGTPLVKKLGLKPGMTIALIDEPADYLDLLGGLPADTHQGTHEVNYVHIFAVEAHILSRHLTTWVPRIARDGMIWVSWPKQASRVPTDITEQTVRDIALPMGLVDVKVCAVDAVWSALKLVIPLKLRNG